MIMIKSIMIIIIVIFLPEAYIMIPHFVIINININIIITVITTMIIRLLLLLLYALWDNWTDRGWDYIYTLFSHKAEQIN